MIRAANLTQVTDYYKSNTVSKQNILDIKIKLETQAKNEFSEANRAYLIEKEKLHAGKNYGKLTLKSPYQTLEHTVCVYQKEQREAVPEKREEHTELSKMKCRLTESYIRFRLKQMSIGFPILFRGVSFFISSFIASSILLFISVSITPGAIALTLIFDGPSSLAKAFVIPLIPALDTEYATSQEAPIIPHIEEIFIIQPLLLCIIFGNTSCIAKNAEFRFVPNISFQSSSVMSLNI